jgi:hypothetical protein
MNLWFPGNTLATFAYIAVQRRLTPLFSHRIFRHDIAKATAAGVQ